MAALSTAASVTALNGAPGGEISPYYAAQRNGRDRSPPPSLPLSNGSTPHTTAAGHTGSPALPLTDPAKDTRALISQVSGSRPRTASVRKAAELAAEELEWDSANDLGHSVSSSLGQLDETVRVRLVYAQG